MNFIRINRVEPQGGSNSSPRTLTGLCLVPQEPRSDHLIDADHTFREFQTEPSERPSLGVSPHTLPTAMAARSSDARFEHSPRISVTQ